MLSAAFLGAFAGQAFGDDCIHRRGGTWVSPQAASLKVHLSVSPPQGLTVEVEGRALAIRERQVSPDRQTILIWWEGGEGVLTCGEGDTVNASLFDRSIPVRTLTLVRPQG